MMNYASAKKRGMVANVVKRAAPARSVAVRPVKAAPIKRTVARAVPVRRPRPVGY